MKSRAKSPRSKRKTDERRRIDDTYLRALAKRIHILIHEKGYGSPYEFWIERSDGLFSRASLNLILNGRRDARITTLRILAECLDMSVDELLRFPERAPRYSSISD